jgi:hypothetical protein
MFPRPSLGSDNMKRSTLGTYVFKDQRPCRSLIFSWQIGPSRCFPIFLCEFDILDEEDLEIWLQVCLILDAGGFISGSFKDNDMWIVDKGIGFFVKYSIWENIWILKLSYLFS